MMRSLDVVSVGGVTNSVIILENSLSLLSLSFTCTEKMHLEIRSVSIVCTALKISLGFKIRLFV